METWRLIIHKKQNGAWNMAVDEALLESTAANQSPPTLRLYDWEPYTLSLGYAQPISDVDMDMLITCQWGLVRRPTGGKAILHADELTYSVTASESNKILSGSVLESYQRLSLALLKGLEAIGIIADSKPKEDNIQHSLFSSVCFQHPSDYEITFNRKKLIGSAQARKKGGVLQHGAIPLYGRISRIIDVLAYSSEQEREMAEIGLRQRATTITEILKRKFSWMEMASAIRKGFEETLDLQFVNSDLNDFETRRAQQILEEKYASDQWTKRI